MCLLWFLFWLSVPLWWCPLVATQWLCWLEMEEQLVEMVTRRKIGVVGFLMGIFCVLFCVKGVGIYRLIGEILEGNLDGNGRESLLRESCMWLDVVGRQRRMGKREKHDHELVIIFFFI